MAKTSLIETEIIKMIVTLLEDKDTYTGAHSKRVATYALKIGQYLVLSHKEQVLLYYAGLLHDIGKILTPDTILIKPTHLTHEEYEIIKQHPYNSKKILSSITPLRKYANIVLYHHERYDGSGYPHGLKEEEIPLLSRILCIADAFDAMTSSRIYQPKKNFQEAIEEIRNLSGKQFDPNLIEISIQTFTALSTEPTSAQKPKTHIDMERFAYFFKDSLTGLYSSKYLNYFLQESVHTAEYKCCYFLQIHHMHDYNKKFGWAKGNEIIIQIAQKIKSKFNTAFIFRVFGDDFVILNHSHYKIEEDTFITSLCNIPILSFNISHLNLKDTPIDNWEKLEKIFGNNA